MKPVIFCLEDGLLYKTLLEQQLTQLLGDQAEIHFFYSLSQLKQTSQRCDLLISDLYLGDAHGEKTAEFLLSFCRHTPVIVQSTDPYLPGRLESLGNGHIIAVEKAGRGPIFESALSRLLQSTSITITEQLNRSVAH